MARELVPIRVTIELNENGQASYPDFNNLNAVKSSKYNDWSFYVDREGIGWHYDNRCPFGVHDPNNATPHDCQHGGLLVPKAFAEEAVRIFPLSVRILTESEWEDFYDNRSHYADPDELIDVDQVNALAAKQAAGQTLTASQQRQLDPNDQDAVGIRRNVRKRWNDRKQSDNITIISP